jgi:hypothetical protein
MKNEIMENSFDQVYNRKKIARRKTINGVNT